MKLVIDATEVAEDLADCKPGESKLITITVGSNDGKTITGDATAVEYAEDEEEEEPEGETKDEEEDDEEEAMAHHKGKKMPKAILIVAGK